jgi:hypothetical protein
VPWDDASVDLTLAPIHPAAGQLVTGLEGADVLLAVAGGFGVHRADDLCAMAAVAGPMCHAGFGAAILATAGSRRRKNGSNLPSYYPYKNHVPYCS